MKRSGLDAYHGSMAREMEHASGIAPRARSKLNSDF